MVQESSRASPLKDRGRGIDSGSGITKLFKDPAQDTYIHPTTRGKRRFRLCNFRSKKVKTHKQTTGEHFC